MTVLSKLSIRALLMLLVLAVVLPAAAMIAWLIAAQSGQAREAAYVRVKSIAQNTADGLGSYLQDHQAVLGRLATLPLVQALDAKKCDPAIGEYVRLNPEFTTLAVRDLNGNSICSFRPTPPPQFIRGKFAWFDEAVHSRSFTVSDAFLGYRTGRWVSVLTHSILNREGEVSGLLILPLDLRQLQQRLFGATPGSAVISVVDRRDAILLRSADHDAWVGKSAAPVIAVTHGHADGFRSARGLDNVPRLYAFVTVPGTDWRVFAGLPQDEVFAEYRALLNRGIGLGVTMLLLVIVLALRISRIVMKPVQELVRTCEKIADGDTAARAQLAGPREIESVARQFNRMLDVRAGAEEALRESEERLHGIVHMTAEAIVVVDEQFNVVLFNPAAETIFRCTAAEAMGQNLARFIPERLRASYLQHLATLAPGGQDVFKGNGRSEIFGLRADGTEFPLEISVSRITRGDSALYSAVVSDISERKQNETRLHALVNYDALTLLPNRTLFHERLRRALVHAQRFNEGLAVLFIDLDRFKNVNDTLGHDAGDQVLRSVAERLKNNLREVDTLARLGGDEFAVLIEKVTDTRMVGGVAYKLLKAVAELLMLGDQEYHITASIGISTHPADGSDGTTLLKNADIAMYRAKERGKNNSQFYSAAMNAHSLERLSLETGMRHALERGEFLLHYQPKVNIASGRIIGVEALVRWLRPGFGMISPAEFIPLAEETGLIVPIGAWVLKVACERNRAWQEMGIAPLRIAVNLSARQFAKANLVSDVARVLDASGLAPPSLELEITESMVMDNPERAIQTLRQLKSMGVALAIDDFGTGYSSLGYLKRFPIDNIKIDRSFIKDIPGNNDDATITRTIIAMTHNLRLKVVAEGVETEAQLDFLREHGCDEMQGYYFSPPLAEDAFLALVQAQQQKAALAA